MVDGFWCFGLSRKPSCKFPAAMVDLGKSGKFNSDCNSLPSKLMQAFSKCSPRFRFFNVIQAALLLLRDMALILNHAWYCVQGMVTRARSIEFMPFLLFLFNFKETGLVWLCLCWSYWHLHYGKCIDDNWSSLSKFLYTSSFKLWKHDKKSCAIWCCSPKP